MEGFKLMEKGREKMTDKRSCFVRALAEGYLAAIALLYVPQRIDPALIVGTAGQGGGLACFIAELRLLTHTWGMECAALALGMICLLGWLANWAETERSAGQEEQEAGKFPYERRIYFACALLFAVFMIAGKGIKYAGEIVVLYGTPALLFMSVVSTLGYTALFYRSILFLGGWVVRLAQDPGPEPRKKWLCVLLEERPFLSSFVLMVLLEIPYWVAFYPGTAMADSLLQLTMYYGPNALSNHHPVFSTLLMGTLNDIGRAIGGNNFGLFLYAFLQSMLQFLLFATAMLVCKKLKLHYGCRLGILAFLALFPAMRIYAITMLKDTSQALAFFLFVLVMLFYWLDDKEEKRWTVLLFLSGLLTCMFRNSGYYVLLIALFSLIFKDKRWKRIAVLGIMMAAVVVINSLVHSVFLPAIGSAKGSVREMLSIPTQQTARYCREYPDDLSEEELEILNRVFPCGVEELGQKYAPELSNNTKESFLLDPTAEDLVQYFKTWWQGLIKHPGTYINAAAAQNYGYWFPDREVFDVISYYRIESNPLSEEEFASVQLRQNDTFATARIAIQNVHETIEKLPVVGYLYSCGIYTWAALFLCAVLLAKRCYREVWFFLPLFASIGVNCVSPVNAYFRYAFPVIAALPLFFIFTLAVLRRAQKKER